MRGNTGKAHAHDNPRTVSKIEQTDKKCVALYLFTHKSNSRPEGIRKAKRKHKNGIVLEVEKEYTHTRAGTFSVLFQRSQEKGIQKQK